MGDSLKTEEKTKTVDVISRGGRILRHSMSLRLTHQCTNWEWFEPGRTNASQRFELFSLERR